MKKFFGHLKTVINHKRLVMYHAVRIGIPFRGLMHDLSKFSPVEFFAGVKYFSDGKKSPNELERNMHGYSSAWMHHKGRNKHHFEYWTDYNPVFRKVGPVKMEYVYVLEMFCDRVAASKVYQGKNYTDSHPIEYFMRGKPNRMIHQATSDAIEYLLVLLSEKGEEYTLNYIKNHRRELEEEYKTKPTMNEI